MKAEKMRELLIRSFDQKLKPEEHESLEMGLLAYDWLREERDQYLKIRETAARSTFSFARGFENRVMEGLAKAKLIPANGEWNQALNRWFGRVAMAGAAAIVVLLLNAALNSKTVSVDELTGAGALSEEVALTYLLYEN